jgi:hypothetical protein
MIIIWAYLVIKTADMLFLAMTDREDADLMATFRIARNIFYLLLTVAIYGGIVWW